MKLANELDRDIDRGTICTLTVRYIQIGSVHTYESYSMTKIRYICVCMCRHLREWFKALGILIGGNTQHFS